MSYEEDDDDVENPESAAYNIDPNNVYLFIDLCISIK